MYRLASLNPLQEASSSRAAPEGGQGAACVLFAVAKVRLNFPGEFVRIWRRAEDLNLRN